MVDAAASKKLKQRIFADLSVGQRNKGGVKTHERLVNEVETTVATAEDADVLLVEGSTEHIDFDELDRSCLTDQGTDRPTVTAPAIPNAARVKYAR